MSITTTETHERTRVLCLNHGEIERILLNHMLKLADMPSLEQERERIRHYLDWRHPNPGIDGGNVTITIIKPLNVNKKRPAGPSLATGATVAR
jgi:hypothetical protein